MRRENEKLIIDGNAIYELDLECVRKKQGKQDGNGRCVEQSEERRQSVNHTGDLKQFQERVFAQSVIEKETRKHKNAFRICLKKGTGENSRCPDFLKRTEKTALFHMWET